MSEETRYNPAQIEPKWQQRWTEAGLFRTPAQSDRPKFYYLDMFPYPSGDLHVGHVRNYAIGDVVARYRTMNGFQVLHPMGFDAFGLPAENAAIKTGARPDEWTFARMDAMRQQFDRLGISFDWSREVRTCTPDYYRWTQWLFLQFFKRGLAERRKSLVNWCPNDQTVLANEQVKDGKCDRCGTLVEQKALTQWFFKITDYAQRLLDDLDTLTDWPERVVKMQREWIGRSEGTTFTFPLKDGEGNIEVFTTRVDTVFGVTYMTLAPDHPLVDELVRGTDKEGEVAEFRNRVARQKDAQRDAGGYGDIPKEGLSTGAFCTNPMTGEDVPIWLGNYVLSDYGSGAVMAVPAHDQRDWEFARAHDLPIKVVVAPTNADQSTLGAVVDAAAFEDYGVLINSGEFDGLSSADAKKAITAKMKEMGIGRATINYRLRDWCLSRQRYWGCPIPVVYREDGSAEAVPEDQLPVLLPTDVQFTGQGNPLLTSESWLQTTDSQGQPARRETDTMDTFVDSSWYFLRFCSPDATDAPFRREEVERWMPIDQYVGGVEHATMHLIYARFFTKVLFDMGFSPVSEPFPRLFTQGMVT
ncbi:MAG: leucyl-tRNA synthetase, partial [Abditibacteriota bacterium]|nr:leucyl-tRNA synthetase [Abditibacteriota bacterium]